MSNIRLGLAAMIGAILVSACANSIAAPPPLADVQDDGRAVAQTQCSSCHAIGAAGVSPLAGAPPFREMARHYNLDALAAELDNGLPTGHPPMPHFKLGVRGVDALMAYMRSVQTPDEDSKRP